MYRSDIRRSILAGTWYPAEPRELTASIERYLSRAAPAPPPGRVVGLLAPHAGHVYSGAVAAYAYASVRGKAYDTVILVSPSHRTLFNGVSIFPRGAYETPLGQVPVDQALAEVLQAQGTGIHVLPEAHAQEHAVEVQLPFLQVALGTLTFVPLIMGDQSRETCEGLARAISTAARGRNVLLVASSDLSHFHGYNQAVRMDRLVLSRLESMDANGLLEDMGHGVSEACGGGPTASVMMAASELGAKRAVVLQYANSGDVTGDRHSVVGYAAAAFCRPGAKGDIG